MSGRILVVDDEIAVNQTLRGILERDGYQADGAASLDEARDRLRQPEVDVVLLDLSLGAEDGLELLAGLRETAPETASIVLTGYGTLASATRALQLGVAEYLLKPCPVDELRAAVARAAERCRTSRGARRQIEDERARILNRERAARQVAEEAANRLAHLQEATLQLSRPMAPEEVFRRIVDAACQLLRCPVAAVFLIDDATGDFRLALGRGLESSPSASWHLPRASSLAGQVVDRGQARVVNDLRPHRDPSNVDDDVASVSEVGLPRLIGAPNVGALLAAPIVAAGRPLGVVEVYSPTPGSFTPADASLLSALATTAAVALANAQAFGAELGARRRAERAAKRIARLQAVTAGLAIALTPDDIGEQIITHGVDALGASAGALFRVGEGGSILRLVSAGGQVADRLASWRCFPIDAPVPAAEAIRTREPVWLESFEAFAKKYPSIADDSFFELGVAFVCLLLLAAGTPIGVLSFRFGQSHAFDPDDREFALTLSRLCAQALERAVLYDDARAAIRLRDEFLSIAAHELKTPVASLLLLAESALHRLSRTGAIEADRVQGTLLDVTYQSRRLSRLVGQLLDVAALGADRLQLSPVPIDVASLVRQVVASVQLHAPNAVFVVQANDPVVVAADPMRLERVVTNLLDNAIKYAGTTGPIEVNAKLESPGSAAIVVADRGPGISPEHRERIFDRFSRASNDPHIDGLGLGLFISRQIVELHGGRLDAEFPPEGGARFVLRLPRGGQSTG